MFHDAQTAKSCSRFEPCLIRLHRATHRQSASEHREHVMMLSLSCWQRGQVEAAKSVCRKALEEFDSAAKPSMADVWYSLGLVHDIAHEHERWSAACARRVTSAARYSNKELQSQVILFELKSGRCELSRL